MAICFTESHTVNTDSVLVQCSAKATEDFGILFSLTTESGKLLMVNAVDGRSPYTSQLKSSLTIYYFRLLINVPVLSCIRIAT